MRTRKGEGRARNGRRGGTGRDTDIFFKTDDGMFFDHFFFDDGNDLGGSVSPWKGKKERKKVRKKERKKER